MNCALRLRPGRLDPILAQAVASAQVGCALRLRPGRLGPILTQTQIPRRVMPAPREATVLACCNGFRRDLHPATFVHLKLPLLLPERYSEPSISGKF